MFIQVWQGKVADAAAMKARLEKWLDDLAPSAHGWLGSTAGVTADGEFVGVVRFSDEESARRNSDRPEQGEWWAGTADLFDGDVEFHDYPHVSMMLQGGSDDAGFVQVIQGTYTGAGSPDDFTDDADEIAERRPDVIGATLAWADDGHFTQTIYFSSEEEARKGEKAMEAEDADRQQEWTSQVDGIQFLDLTDPWTASP